MLMSVGNDYLFYLTEGVNKVFVQGVSINFYQFFVAAIAWPVAILIVIFKIMSGNFPEVF